MARTWTDNASTSTRPARWAVALVVTAATVAAGTTGPARAAEPVATGTDKGSLAHIAAVVGALGAYRAGYTGKGVGIALIDTGVAPVAGLTSGNVVDGPDLSFDAAVGGPKGIDGYGHGTHMAGIIAGRDGADTPAGYAAGRRWHGIAPDATLYNVKVGAHDGACDVSQVIAAINRVVEHRNDTAVPIRVISLSYGTDSVQSSQVDPLAFAVESAWRKGVVVVAAAGNDGRDVKSLASPAHDPYVIAVGAADTAGTVTTRDDTVPSFANAGSSSRHVDVVAPAISVLGLRNPGSLVDDLNPKARVDDRFFRGTGTSQATAVTAGVVALLLQRYPAMTPDQVKHQLMATARPFAARATLRGSGMVDVAAAISRPATAASQPAAFYGTGTGSLELARGTNHVADDGVPLTGETDVQGNAWDGAAWAAATTAGTTWDGDIWNGSSWTGSSWTGSSWTGKTWVGKTWVGKTWVGKTWVGKTWVGKTWVGKTWVDSSWAGSTWS